mmetsp:Transcript_61811/g.70911  ORF Transcript_61811/g.70911 Transcript_61811/m.70911 type:complete len:256 (+) Transcript_61811:3281-4048(+)
MDLVIHSLELSINLQLSEDGLINAIKSIYALGYLLLGVKTVYFLRGYEATGFLINMIQQVLRDMMAFLLIIIVATLSFAGAFFMLQPYQDGTGLTGDSSAINILYGTYLILLGSTEFPLSFLGDWTRLLFVLSTFFYLIVMLNLLISVIGDTFDKVQGQAEQARNVEILTLIVEYQQLFRHNSEDKTYVYFFGPQKEGDEAEEDESGRWKGRVQEISRLVDKLKRGLKDHLISKKEMQDILKLQLTEQERLYQNK